MSHSAATGESFDGLFRLIHASDLHLDQPPFGMNPIPDHLRDRLIDCPYASAESVFDAALIEAVDGLILAGDIVDLDLAGPRAIVFLRDQFTRLAEQNIPIFWLGGSCDPPSAWPPSVPLPENVHRFPIGRVESHPLVRDGKPIARIVGTSHGHGDSESLERLHRDPGGLPTIGILYGALDSDCVARSQVDYLALGGRHDRTTFTSSQRTAHYPGTSQGRSPAEPGRRGCTLVEISSAGQVNLKALATEVIRWYTESIETDHATTLASIETTLTKRMESLVAKCSGDDLLVTWRLTGTAPILNEIRRARSEQLIARLRKQFGHNRPAAWTVDLSVERTAALPESWYDQQTILGDVLRRVRELQYHPDLPLVLTDYLAPADQNGALVSIANLSTPRLRQEILEEAAALAADLLTVPSSGVA